jgi:hypothetical protein
VLTVAEWISFKGVSPHGERRRGTLEHFVAFLIERRIARTKASAPGFSATAYRQHYVHETYSEISQKIIRFAVDAPAAYRSGAGVESQSAWVGDLDHDEPDWARLQRTGNLIVTWQTWSHSTADPHWRIVVPVVAAIAVEEWPSAFMLGVERFEPRSDTSCADPAHLFWLPAGRPHKDIDIRVIEGAPWAPQGLTTAPPESPRFRLRPPADREATAEETAAARRILEATCRKLANHPAGGRQVAAYGHARMVGHLVAAGALDESDACAALWDAVAGEGGNGVGAEREPEVKRALRRGLNKGIEDGAYAFEGPASWTRPPLSERSAIRTATGPTLSEQVGA